MLALGLLVLVQALPFEVFFVQDEWFVERLVLSESRLADDLRLDDVHLFLRKLVLVPHAPHSVVGVEEVLHALRSFVGLDPHNG